MHPEAVQLPPLGCFRAWFLRGCRTPCWGGEGRINQCSTRLPDFHGRHQSGDGEGGCGSGNIIREWQLGFAVGWASGYHVILLSVVCLVVCLGMLDSGLR